MPEPVTMFLLGVAMIGVATILKRNAIK
ncbi:MAG: PEP-CTERM sorting domain-containing protein [Nitrospinales bacterium]